MSSLRAYLDSFLASFRQPAPAAPQPSGPPPVDVAEELKTVQRNLRRLSLGQDQSNETLKTVSQRLDEMQQRLLALSRPAQAGLSLGEAQVLRVLDQLDRAASMMEGSIATLEPVAAAGEALRSAAGWQRVALLGSRPDGADIQIAEVEPGASAAGGDVVISQVIEQGYRRADGSLLRRAVVIAAPAGKP